MDKNLIIDQLTGNVKKELEKIKQAYETTKNLVQNGDLKSDGKYDTRATEANYLADGQRSRITELEQELELLEEINIKDQYGSVSIGSLVEIELNNQSRDYFVSPTAGGTMLDLDGRTILVISVFSPIGDAALGLNTGDYFEIELKESLREYKIKSIN